MTKPKTPKSKTAGKPRAEEVQKLAKPGPKRFAPAQEAEVRRLAAEEVGKIAPAILTTARQNAQAIVNNSGGKMMEFFAEIVQEGVDLQEVIDKNGAPPNAAAPTATDFLRVFRLGLDARIKRDTRTAEKQLREAGLMPPAGTTDDSSKNVGEKPKVGRKTAIRRVK